VGEAAPVSRKTLWALAGLVLLLALAAWRQLAREERQDSASEVRLFEGVDPARVVRMRVENLVRDQHLLFERDAAGRWSMVDPMAAPADQALVGHLFQTALERRATPVPPEEARAADLGLDPPRIVLEMEEDIDGERRRTRVDFGAIELDNAHMSVRAQGRFLRTWRDLDTTLDHGLQDFLEHHVVDFPVGDVVKFHRRGSLVRPGAADASDLAFDAELADEGWRATSPYAAALDPQGSALFVQGVGLLQAKAYADFGQRLLSDFGLDPPEVALTVDTLAGRHGTIRFGRPGHQAGGEWHACVEGRPFVWTVEERAVQFFAAPVEEFLDHALTRIPVASADGVTFEIDGRELRIWLDRPEPPSKPTWMVSERTGRETAYTPGAEADRHRVEDLLGAIARTEIATFLPGEAVADSEATGSIVVQAGDLRQGGRLGAEVQGAEGGRALRFQRNGDSLAGLVPLELRDLLATRAQDLWSLVVVELVEVEQTELRLARGDAVKRYVRSSKGLWTPPGIGVEAKELHEVLDALMIVRAAKHVAPEATPTLEDPIAVEVTSSRGDKVQYWVGLAEGAAEGERVQVQHEGRRAVAKDQELHTKLARILENR